MKRICKQCGKEFVLTQDEIAFYQSKNLHIPKRCEECRKKNKASGKTEERAQPAQVVRAYHGKENRRKKSWTIVVAVLILLTAVIIGSRMGLLPSQNEGEVQEQTVQTPMGNMPDISETGNPKSAQDGSEAESSKNARDVSEAESSKSAQDGSEAENPKSAPDISETESPKSASDIADAEKSSDDAGERIDEAAVPAVAYNFRKAEYLQEHFDKHGAEFGYASAAEYLAGANRVIASPEALHKLEAEDGDDVYYLESTNEFVIVSTDGFLRTYFKPEDGKAYFDRQ